MAFRYTHVFTGQVIESAEPLDYLNGLARWQIEEFDGKPSTPQPESDGRPKPTDSKAVWVDYAKSKGATDEDLDGLTKADIESRY